MSLPKINLVVIGHKDHGKSSLIGRLLYDSKAIPEQKLREIESELGKTGGEAFQFAFILDTLEEERKGGLTIDIMQTPFKTGRHIYTIIDCPGHREFIKKMLTGASQADAAILVVSAKEGVQDQTKQHLFLAKILGIKQLVVAVNKMDEVNYDEEKFKEMLESLQPILKSLGYSGVPIVPVSALEGENVFKESGKMPWYKGSSLISTLDQNANPSKPPDDKPLRACVQDVYKLEGNKTIICRILTGMLEKGQTVIFDPSGGRGVVKKIESFGKEIERARPGDSIGIIVDGLSKEVERGEVISYPQQRANTPKRFVAEIILFSDVEVERNDVLTIRCGTAEKKCKVQEILERIDPVNLTIDAKLPELLVNGDVGKLMLTPVEPFCVEEYSEFPELGRFVVKGKTGAVAAGIVVKAEAGK
ncbi:MAG: GTP-binding protein [Thermoproteota archaeon]